MAALTAFRDAVLGSPGAAPAGLSAPAFLIAAASSRRGAAVMLTVGAILYGGLVVAVFVRRPRATKTIWSYAALFLIVLSAVAFRNATDLLDIYARTDQKQPGAQVTERRTQTAMLTSSAHTPFTLSGLFPASASAASLKGLVTTILHGATNVLSNDSPATSKSLLFLPETHTSNRRTGFIDGGAFGDAFIDVSSSTDTSSSDKNSLNKRADASFKVIQASKKTPKKKKSSVKARRKREQSKIDTNQKNASGLAMSELQRIKKRVLTLLSGHDSTTPRITASADVLEAEPAPETRTESGPVRLPRANPLPQQPSAETPPTPGASTHSNPQPASETLEKSNEILTRAVKGAQKDQTPPETATAEPVKTERTSNPITTPSLPVDHSEPISETNEEPAPATTLLAASESAVPADPATLLCPSAPTSAYISCLRTSLAAIVAAAREDHRLFSVTATAAKQLEKEAAVFHARFRLFHAKAMLAEQEMASFNAAPRYFIRESEALVRALDGILRLKGVEALLVEMIHAGERLRVERGAAGLKVSRVFLAVFRVFIGLQLLVGLLLIAAVICASEWVRALRVCAVGMLAVSACFGAVFLAEAQLAESAGGWDAAVVGVGGSAEVVSAVDAKSGGSAVESSGDGGSSLLAAMASFLPGGGGLRGLTSALAIQRHVSPAKQRSPSKDEAPQRLPGRALPATAVPHVRALFTASSSLLELLRSFFASSAYADFFIHAQAIDEFFNRVRFVRTDFERLTKGKIDTRGLFLDLEVLTRSLERLQAAVREIDRAQMLLMMERLAVARSVLKTAGATGAGLARDGAWPASSNRETHLLPANLSTLTPVSLADRLAVELGIGSALIGVFLIY